MEVCADDGNVIGDEAVTILRLCAFEIALGLWSVYNLAWVLGDVFWRDGPAKVQDMKLREPLVI